MQSIEKQSHHSEVLNGVLNNGSLVVVIPACFKDVILRDFHQSIEGMYFGIKNFVACMLVAWITLGCLGIHGFV